MENDKQFTEVKAIFNPKRTDNLRPELKDLIGQEFIFQYVWIMDEDDPFPNVWALTTMDERFPYWCPEFDLDIIEELD